VLVLVVVLIIAVSESLYVGLYIYLDKTIHLRMGDEKEKDATEEIIDPQNTLDTDTATKSK